MTRNGRMRLRAGELVEICNEDEIQQTLDEAGALDGLPFMPEMLAYCGRQARVHRRVEKIWDMSGNTQLRRLHDTVVLQGLRCDGAAHDGCQAGCNLLWKEAWLKRCGTNGRVTALTNGGAPRVELVALTRRGGPDALRYVCQATELPRASSAMPQDRPGHYLRELLVGNVGVLDFLQGVSIALFNRVQHVRGGVGYPHLVPQAASPTPNEVLGLAPGELVTVRSKQEIEATLDGTQRNRGLWFDLEMLRYCGGRYRVLHRVDHLIDERSGRMSHLRTPCVILEGVVATGEYHAFRAQGEYILWREIWLRRSSD